MSEEERILNLIKVNNGIITSKQSYKHGINRIFLTRLVKSRKIERVKNRLYVLSNTWNDESFNLWNKRYFFHMMQYYIFQACAKQFQVFIILQFVEDIMENEIMRAM